MDTTTSGETADRIPVALTIAGSDPSGGAGLQADLKAFDRMGVYGTSVATALTAQNTGGVRDFFPMTAEQVRLQIETLVDDICPDASKTGMLATPDIVREVAAQAAAGRLGRLVVDPVLVSTSGHDLAAQGLARDLTCDLIPLSELVTPNIREAMILTGVEINNVEDAKEAALAMTEMEAKAICITGGHLRGDPVDVLFDGDDFIELRGRRLGEQDKAIHGSGCLFSAAAAAGMARGLAVADAVSAAKDLVEKSLERAFRPGKGMPVPWLPVEPA